MAPEGEPGFDPQNTRFEKLKLREKKKKARHVLEHICNPKARKAKPGQAKDPWGEPAYGTL